MSKHETKVIRIEEILPHPNADRLALILVGGFQVVVRKDQFKTGDLAIYVEPDSIVPEMDAFSFVWEKDGGGNPNRHLEAGIPVPEKYRRVTVRRFRKEWSEGLLLPVIDFPILDSYEEGDDVSEVIGITHWNPPEDQEDRDPSVKQSKTMPRSLKGWFYFLKNWALYILTFGHYGWTQNLGDNEKAPKNTPGIYDVENYKNFKDVIQEGEQVVATEKIHGSNGRFLFQPNTLGPGKMYAGSRKLWKKEGSTTIWRKVLEYNPDIRRWCEDHPDYVLYGEVVPTQSGFDYGHKKETPWFYLFDIKDPLGDWVPYEVARGLTVGYDIEWVPLLHQGPFTSEVLKLADGKTKTGGTHIREGVVIKVQPERHERNLGRVQLKVVSNAYLEKEQ